MNETTNPIQSKLIRWGGVARVGKETSEYGL